MTIGNTPDLNYLLEGPEDAPVLVLSGNIAGDVGRAGPHIANVEQPEMVPDLS